MPEPVYDRDEVAKRENNSAFVNSDKKQLGSNELSASEKGQATANASSGHTDVLGKGFTGTTKVQTGNNLATLRGFVGRHKKGIAVGGIGGGFGGLLIAGILFLVTYQLVTIENTFVGYEAKVERKIENKFSQSVLQKIINRAKVKASPATKAEEAAAEAAGEGVTSGIDSFDITDPTIVQDLSNAGLTVETDSTGNLTALRNSDGLDISNDIGTNDDFFNNIANNLPEWETGQVELFRNLMVAHANANFDGIPADAPEDQVDQDVIGDVTEGTAVNEGNLNPSNSEDNPSSNDTNPTDIGNANVGSQGTVVSEGVSVADQAIQSGASGATAIAKGVASIKGAFSNPIFVAGFASTLCSLEQSITKSAQQRVPSITTLLIRHATTVFSLADELKSGNLSSNDLSKASSIFSGDSSVKPTASDPQPEASLPFSSSAAWQRATGGTVNTNPNSPGYTPDIQSSATPTKNSGTKIVGSVNSVLKYSGGSLTCAVLTSPFGFLAQTFAGIVQIAGDIGSFGASQAAISAGIIGGNVVLDKVVLPDVLEYFTPIGVDGHEDSVQWANNTDAGSNLAFNDYSRRLGALPVGHLEADKEYASATTAQNQANEQLSLGSRLFAISNPNSLVSKLALDMPIGLSKDVASIANIFTEIPSVLFHNISTIFTGKRAFAQPASTNPGAPYDITQYGYTDSELNNIYDPISNEQYLFSDITINGQPAMVNGQPVRRIDALGNPNTLTSSQVDPNNNDLLHCFVDSYTDLEENTNGADGIGDNNNCYGLGNYDDGQQPYNSVPTNDTVVSIYCNALQNPSNCASQVAPQVTAGNDIERFRQYLMDLQVVKNYESLSNNQ